VHQDRLFVAAGESLIAYQLADGAKLWTIELGAIEQRPAVHGARVYVPVADGQLVVLDLASGKQIWESSVGIKPTEPFVYDDRVYVGSAAKFFCSLKVRDGSETWCMQVGAAVTGGAVADASKVYFVALDNLLYALDRKNGARRWKADLRYRPSAGPSLVGKTVSAPGLSSRLQAFDAATGKPSGQLTLSESLVFSPVYVVPDEGGEIKLAAVAGGLPNRWTLTLAVPPPPVPPSPAVVPLTALPGQVVPLVPPEAPPGSPPPVA
jgi:outer membrane protein assembly factor BamB